MAVSQEVAQVLAIADDISWILEDPNFEYATPEEMAKAIIEKAQKIVSLAALIPGCRVEVRG